MDELIEEIDIAGILESADSHIQILNAFDRMEFKMFQCQMLAHRMLVAAKNGMSAIKRLKDLMALQEFRELIESPDWRKYENNA